MSRPRKPVHFGGQRYSSSPDIAHEQKARDPSRPGASRLVEATKAKANLWGHAGFTMNELRSWLASRSGRPAGERTIYDALNKAKEWGDLAPVSTPRCLVLYREDWTRGYGRWAVCHEQTHDGHRHHEWRRESGWGIWRPPAYVTQAQVEPEVAGQWLLLDEATGYVVNTETGEILNDAPSWRPAPDALEPRGTSAHRLREVRSAIDLENLQLPA